jgi:hypothetical protein
MQLHAIKMNPFYSMTCVYGFDQLLNNTWQFKTYIDIKWIT